MPANEPAAGTRRCPGCAAELELTGLASGTWLACPSCGRPFEVPRQVYKRPAGGPEITAGWLPADFPSAGDAQPGPTTVDPQARPIGEPPAADPRKPWIEGRNRRLGCLNLLLGALIGGVLQVAYVAGFLGLRNPGELQASWAFGFAFTLATIWLVKFAVGPRAPRHPYDF